MNRVWAPLCALVLVCGCGQEDPLEQISLKAVRLRTVDHVDQLKAMVALHRPEPPQTPSVEDGAGDPEATPSEEISPLQSFEDLAPSRDLEGWDGLPESLGEEPATFRLTFPELPSEALVGGLPVRLNLDKEAVVPGLLLSFDEEGKSALALVKKTKGVRPGALINGTVILRRRPRATLAPDSLFGPEDTSGRLLVLDPDSREVRALAVTIIHRREGRVVLAEEVQESSQAIAEDWNPGVLPHHVDVKVSDPLAASGILHWSGILFEEDE